MSTPFEYIKSIGKHSYLHENFFFYLYFNINLLGKYSLEYLRIKKKHFNHRNSIFKKK